ncbi:MAG TPA: hypothetical protein VJL84_02325 [Kiloniellales bacterium]|nr:hypothetical protein [Kiloniellales bacterium]
MRPLALLALSTLLPAVALGDEITTAAGNAADPALDLVRASVSRDGRDLIFALTVAGEAGSALPAAAGALGGATVWSYVWPTGLDSAIVGFEAGQGILAFAVTVHPDFDDTPLFDEDGDGTLDNDGARWHSHWVVLEPDGGCGAGSLKVKAIPEGATPRLPKTWPGLPILIDSPGWAPRFEAATLRVRVPFEEPPIAGTAYDGVTAALRVNASVHDPLLCVVDVFDVASGDLSLPGRVE